MLNSKNGYKQNHSVPLLRVSGATHLHHSLSHLSSELLLLFYFILLIQHFGVTTVTFLFIMTLYYSMA